MPTLGETIRGARLGWRWCDGLGGFLRVSDARDGVLVDLRPARSLPRKVEDDSGYRCWWEHAEEAVVAAVRPLVFGSLAGGTIRRTVRIVLDDEGRPRARLA